MAAKSESKGGLANNLAAQLGLLAIAVVILIAIAWKYMW